MKNEKFQNEKSSHVQFFRKAQQAKASSHLQCTICNLYFIIFHYSFSLFTFSAAKLQHFLHIRNPHLYGFSFDLSPF